MSSQYKFENHAEELRQQSKVKLTDLLSRINEEKKIERNRNLALSVAAISAVTVFGIILTIAVFGVIALQLTLLTRQRRVSTNTDSNSDEQVQSYARQTEEKLESLMRQSDEKLKLIIEAEIPKVTGGEIGNVSKQRCELNKIIPKARDFIEVKLIMFVVEIRQLINHAQRAKHYRKKDSYGPGYC